MLYFTILMEIIICIGMIVIIGFYIRKTRIIHKDIDKICDEAVKNYFTITQWTVGMLGGGLAIGLIFISFLFGVDYKELPKQYGGMKNDFDQMQRNVDNLKIKVEDDFNNKYGPIFSKLTQKIIEQEGNILEKTAAIPAISGRIVSDFHYIQRGNYDILKENSNISDKTKKLQNEVDNKFSDVSRQHKTVTDSYGILAKNAMNSQQELEKLNKESAKLEGDLNTVERDTKKFEEFAKKTHKNITDKADDVKGILDQYKSEAMTASSALIKKAELLEEKFKIIESKLTENKDSVKVKNDK